MRERKYRLQTEREYSGTISKTRLTHRKRQRIYAHIFAAVSVHHISISIHRSPRESRLSRSRRVEV